MMNLVKHFRNTIDQCRKFYWKQTWNTWIDYRTIIKSLRRYRDELFTLKSNVQPVKRGDLRWPQSHWVTPTNIDFLLACASHMILINSEGAKTLANLLIFLLLIITETLHLYQNSLLEVIFLLWQWLDIWTCLELLNQIIA